MEFIYLSKKSKIQGIEVANQGDVSITPFQIKF